MRQQYIDILKGIVIIWVLWMHMDLPELLYPAVQMPVFFFLSGCFYLRKGTIGTQIKADAFHLLLPTVCFMAIAGILMALTGNEVWNGSVIDTIQVCRNASITWFLIALFCFRLFSYPFEKYNIKWVMLVIACILYPIGFMWKVYRPDIIIPIIPIQEMFMFGVYYVIGITMGKWVLNAIIDRGGKSVIYVMLGICYLLLVHLLDWESGWLNHIPWLVYGFFYTLIFIYIGLVFCWHLRKIDWLRRPIAYVGKYSIVFYLTHFLIYNYGFTHVVVNQYLVFVLIVVIEYPLIYLFVNYLPWMIGQKHIVKNR